MSESSPKLPNIEALKKFHENANNKDIGGSTSQEPKPIPPTLEKPAHKCTCNIVDLMQHGCTCKGV